MQITRNGSETAETALRDAFEIGITENASLVLVHGLQPPVAAASPYLPHTIQLTQDEMEAREEHMRAYLERVADAVETLEKVFERRETADRDETHSSPPDSEGDTSSRSDTRSETRRDREPERPPERP